MADIETKLDPISDDNKSLDHSSSSIANADVVSYGQGVDVAVDLVAGEHANDAPVPPDVASRIRRKLDWHLLPLLFLLYTCQGMDKGALGATAILGIKKSAHLSGAQFNNLGSAFYIGFIVFEYGHSLALQRFPVAKWLTFNIFLWALFIGCHAAAKSYGSLFALRFLLGATEGAVTLSVMIVCNMFYNRTEIGERIGWTFQCNGLALIFSSVFSFAVYHANPKASPNQWQWLMIVNSIISFIVFLLFLRFFPNNPSSAWFLTPEERVIAVKRIQENRNGIETKKFKKHQFIEALRDPKTWLFFLFAAISNLQNGIGIQYGIIILSFGFKVWKVTLLSIPLGAVQIVGITVGGLFLRRFPNSRAWIGMGAFVAPMVGAILLVTLPLHNKHGLLAAYYVLNLSGASGFVMVLSWVTSTSAGHTKKLTTNGIFMIGYALGQILSTQFWKDSYKPRNYVPWGITMGSYAGNWVLLLTLRWYLQRENKRRDQLQAGLANEDDMFGYVERADEKGQVVRQKVEKALLDLTDRENLSFRYVL
ncbi:MFS general substrate transporter [Cantharellus anzutake]|uniref:MFS general substrate transporter n=1 Tax=Cantharellus anzutake TaxID=1750568 RepID=UPI0019042CA2|nr:MFS general substrate transporter [Cantharellus anzutake]KAF8343124.1 MFS general substrate transporter [Cantharellus anzutake]